MKRLLYLSAMVCCLALGSALAESSSSDTSTTMPDKAELEAALSACASSAGNDSKGQPDMQAMDSCMTKKGFTRPSGPPPGQGRNPPPSK
ncbi:MAG: hypothetical protein WAW02_01665 [Sideroxyarcus sp.]